MYLQGIRYISPASMKPILLISLLLSGSAVFGQLSLEQYEDSLSTLQEALGKGKSNESRLQISASIDSLMNQIFLEPACYDYPFEKVKGMGIIN